MSNRQPAELAVSASWIIPIVPRQRVFSDCSLVVDKNKIIAICPTSDLANRYQINKIVALPGHVLLPGLINSHGHAAMSLLRGLADDAPLQHWLHKVIWPTEKKWLSGQFVQDGTMLAMTEMLKAGTTCFADMYFYPDTVAATAFELGMRAQVNFPIFDFASAWAVDADDYIHKGLALYDTYRSADLITIGFGPHSPYTVADSALTKIATYSAELQASVHIHLHETAHEIAESMEKFGVRPIQRIADIGLLGPTTQCVHMTQVTDSDMALLQESGAHVVHCPQSNLKLASGICPAQQLISHNINVCLGTDSAASNNDLNLFSEAQTAALIGKYAANDATAISASTALEMITINGARAMGLDHKIGSLEPGKCADFIALNLNDITFTPVYDLISQLIYTNVGHRVSHVWVNGKVLVDNFAMVNLSEIDLRAKVDQWQTKLSTT